jgi:hypothetical protein
VILDCSFFSCLLRSRSSFFFTVALIIALVTSVFSTLGRFFRSFGFDSSISFLLAALECFETGFVRKYGYIGNRSQCTYSFWPFCAIYAKGLVYWRCQSDEMSFRNSFFINFLCWHNRGSRTHFKMHEACVVVLIKHLLLWCDKTQCRLELLFLYMSFITNLLSKSVL